ncbi:hypothetical protein HGG75_15410 [Ochrobactrum pseudogrignonense]|nr:hypothetical protein [Brucella pseudogrignonensis]
MTAKTETPAIDKGTTASIAPAKTETPAPAMQPMPEVVVPETTIAKPQQQSSLTTPQPAIEQHEEAISDTTPAQEPEATAIDVPDDAGPAPCAKQQ